MAAKDLGKSSGAMRENRSAEGVRRGTSSASSSESEVEAGGARRDVEGELMVSILVSLFFPELEEAFGGPCGTADGVLEIICDDVSARHTRGRESYSLGLEPHMQVVARDVALELLLLPRQLGHNVLLTLHQSFLVLIHLLPQRSLSLLRRKFELPHGVDDLGEQGQDHVILRRLLAVLELRRRIVVGDQISQSSNFLPYELFVGGSGSEGGLEGVDPEEERVVHDGLEVQMLDVELPEVPLLVDVTLFPPVPSVSEARGEREMKDGLA